MTHTGSCHCGKVRFEFDGAIGAAIECNCSICRRKGALWHACDDAALRILEGREELRDYRFGTGTAQHFFCPHCGIGPFSHPRIAPRMWVINLRCVDGLDLAALPVRPFDGRNWEAAASRLLRPGAGEKA